VHDRETVPRHVGSAEQTLEPRLARGHTSLDVVPVPVHAPVTPEAVTPVETDEAGAGQSAPACEPLPLALEENDILVAARADRLPRWRSASM
jgi:hypothetical protein